MYLGMAAVVCGILALVVLGISGGVHDTLSNAKPGNVYSFDYLQPNEGVPHRHIVKVVGVEKLTEDDIKRLEKRSKYRDNDSIFKRSPTLVKTIDSEGKFRQFYAERAVSVHRLPFGGFRFKVAQSA